MYFFIDKTFSVMMLVLGLLTILNFEDKIYNIKKQKSLKEKERKNEESEEHI